MDTAPEGSNSVRERGESVVCSSGLFRLGPSIVVETRLKGSLILCLEMQQRSQRLLFTLS